MKYLVHLRPPQFVFLVALSLAAIAGLVIQSEAAGVVITINDSTDSIFVSTTNDPAGRVTAFDCPVPVAGIEQCVVVVTPPAGGVAISSANFPFQPGNTTVVIGDPDGITVSDLLGYVQCSTGNCSVPNQPPSPPAPGVSYELNFSSDPPSETPFPNSCSALAGGCQIIETGFEQLAGTVTWNDGTVDTITFISDTEVPEPASFLLMLPGFAAMCAARRFHTLVRPA